MTDIGKQKKKETTVLLVSLNLLLLCLSACLSSDDHQDLVVKPGENVTLSCYSSGKVEVVQVKWIRSDLRPEGNIFHYKDSRVQKDSQLPSYRGRVELKDPEKKNGDFSVVLKNVTFNDAGRYECYVRNTGSVLKLISSFYLTVQDSVNITDESGQSVSLPCRAPSNTEIVVVEWTRPGLGQEYVLLYRDKKPDLHNQLPSYQNRVELKDREMKDGDVSMILNNVTTDDAGTYECRAVMRETNIRRRSAKNEPISIVHLEVHQSGDTEERGDEEGNSRGRVGMGVGLALFVAVGVGVAVAVCVVGVVGVVGGGLFYRKRRGLPGQGSTKFPTDEESLPASTVNIKMEDEVLVSNPSTI